MQIGVDIGSYVFDASARTITFSGVTVTDIEQIKPIVNGDAGSVIFNPAEVGKFGTLLANVLTLQFDTTLQNDTDKLYICVNFVDVELATEANQTTGNNLLTDIKAFFTNTYNQVTNWFAVKVINTVTTNKGANQNHTTITANTASVLLIASNSTRKEVVIYNNSNKDMSICPFTPAVLGQGYYVPAKTGWVIDTTLSALYGIWDTGVSGNAIIQEIYE